VSFRVRCLNPRARELPHDSSLPVVRRRAISAPFALALSIGSALPACADILGIPDQPRLTGDGPSPVPASAVTETPAFDANRLVAPSEPGNTDESGPPRAIGLAGSSTAEEARGRAPLDAGSPPENASDAGSDVAEVPPGASLSDAGVACAGIELFGICWYLGTAGASCDDTCSPHGGPSDAALARVGTRAQGGSPEECRAVLIGLGQPADVVTATRPDDRGVGCHLYGFARDPYWLTGPTFQTSDQLSLARIACGCQR
jgi:hypothetical protein